MKKSNLILLIALGISIVLIVAFLISLRINLSAAFQRGDGNILEQMREINDFEKVRIKGNYIVHYTQDSVVELKVITDSNLHEFIKTTVKNRELVIESYQPVISSKDIRIELSNAFLSAVEATGSAQFISENKLYLPFLSLVANAGARIEIEGIFETLNAIQNAGSMIVLEGRADRLKLESNAGGTIDAFEMEAGYTQAVATAGANINVNTKELEATAIAGASVRYIGDPIIHGSNTSAGGNVRSRN